MTATDLNLANIERAASLIDPVFLNTPQFVDDTLSAALGHRVLVKVETLNPIRSFKGRGSDFFAHSLNPKQKIVCASAGNFGQAMAYSGRRRGIAVEVFVAHDANPAKVARMRSLGATVITAGKDFEDAKEHARRHAAQRAECVFIEDGEDDGISEGAGTISIELLKAGEFDAVVIPLGDGALITGMAAWIKEHSPRPGSSAYAPPALRRCWKAGGKAGSSPRHPPTPLPTALPRAHPSPSPWRESESWSTTWCSSTTGRSSTP